MNRSIEINIQMVTILSAWINLMFQSMAQVDTASPVVNEESPSNIDSPLITEILYSKFCSSSIAQRTNFDIVCRGRYYGKES